MARTLVPDDLWALIEPLLPIRTRRKYHPGRKAVPDRACLAGIIFVLKTGIPWEYLPQEMGCGCGMTCWRRLRDWQRAGVWEKIHRALLDTLREADLLDFARCAVDSASVRAVGGATRPAPTPSIAPNPAANTMF
jgi:transposase